MTGPAAAPRESGLGVATGAVVAVDRLDFRFAPAPWPFADANRAAIAAHFTERQQHASGIWNGRVLLLRSWQLSAGVLGGRFIETDYASFLAWLDWGCPPAGVLNAFALAAVRPADGGLMVGVMGAHTANAGRIYFPGGTPDPSDVASDGRVDLAGSVTRELAEETGLPPGTLRPRDGWRLCIDGPRLALIRLFDAPETGERLAARVAAHLAADPHAELAGVRIARGAADLDPMMPGFVVSFLQDEWARAS